MTETYFGPIWATCFSLPYKRNCPGPLSGPTVTSTGRGYKQRQTIFVGMNLPKKIRLAIPKHQTILNLSLARVTFAKDLRMSENHANSQALFNRNNFKTVTLHLPGLIVHSPMRSCSPCLHFLCNKSEFKFTGDLIQRLDNTAALSNSGLYQILLHCLGKSLWLSRFFLLLSMFFSFLSHAHLHFFLHPEFIYINNHFANLVLK